MEPEFAPRYSPEERRRRLLLHGVICVLLFAALYWWALPRFRSFVPDAPCEAVFGVPASTVLLYAALVGAPIAGAILLVVLTARTSIHAIATRRYPPPGHKVFGRVKVKRGWQAVAFALMPAMVITYLCVLSGQGIRTAAQMAREIDRSADCAADRNKQAPQRGPHQQRPTR
ncbi:MAG TPA: hypothetical protein VGD45_14055 [Steroidobacter sp.]|uniref:hypothetical protein n=1 Tax=Steroidobacter sp. TaxID=1978227 RepID=UPI002EDAE083